MGIPLDSNEHFPKNHPFFEKNVANDIPPLLDDLPMKKHHLYSFTLW
jgi:hypothetical protein